MKSKDNRTVTFVNGVRDTDVWILPDTAENRRTTVWGAATVKAVKAGESAAAPLCDPGDGGLYLLRLIDADGWYYSADGVELQAGWTVKITEEDVLSYTAEVTDENGALQNTYAVFAARL